MAWLTVVALLGVLTLGVLQGMRTLGQQSQARMEHVHAFVVAIRAGDVFAVRVPGRTGVLWFRAARGGHISFAHLWRHLHEHAPTDIVYEQQPNQPLVAWEAD